jgi:hypothetical protein
MLVLHGVGPVMFFAHMLQSEGVVCLLNAMLEQCVLLLQATKYVKVTENLRVSCL